MFFFGIMEKRGSYYVGFRVNVVAGVTVDRIWGILLGFYRGKGEENGNYYVIIRYILESSSPLGGFGYIIIRSPYIPDPIYLRGTI